MKKNKQLIPKRRFKEFENDGEWEQYIVKDIFRVTRGDVLAATKTTEIKTPSMPYPVYSSQTKNNGLMGYYKDFLFEDAITWTTDGANAGTVSYRQGKFYCTNVSGVLLSDKGYANKMVSENLNKVAWKHVSKVGNPKLMNNVMGEIIISIPNKIEEQNRIARFLTKLDKLISHNQYKIKRLKDLKSGYLSDLFPKEGEKYPKKRFEGFTEPWEQYKLGELGTVAMNKRIFKDETSETGEIPFYKIGTFGKEPDAYISRELFEEYKSKYSYPSIGDILISASGSIGRTVVYTGEDEYFQDSNIVWLNHNNRINNIFLKQFYKIVSWKGLEGSTIKRLYNKNILDTEIILPKLDEQEKVGNFFKNLDAQIDTEEQKLNKLEQLKQAYLNELFV